MDKKKVLIYTPDVINDCLETVEATETTVEDKKAKTELI